VKIIAFSQYLAYQVGGAEAAMFELLRQRYNQFDAIHILGFRKLTYQNVIPRRHEFPVAWDVHLLNRPFNFSLFPFVEYWLNQNNLRRQIAFEEGDQLIASSIYAPAALAGFPGKRAIYIQSEGELGFAHNHEQGLRRWLKTIYLLLEAPFRFFYRKQLARVLGMRNCSIYCNSRYTESVLQRHFGISADAIIHPFFNEKKLKTDFAKVKNTVEQKGIVFIGDTAHKGVYILQELAAALPEERFYHFSRQEQKQTTFGNIVRLGWQSNPVEVYKYAKLVIMPSQWRETFGRVARESCVLGIPVLVSKTGGLPEAVFYDEESLVEEYKNVEAWIKAVQTRLKQLP